MRQLAACALFEELAKPVPVFRILLKNAWPPQFGRQNRLDVQCMSDQNQWALASQNEKERGSLGYLLDRGLDPCPEQLRVGCVLGVVCFPPQLGTRVRA